MQHNKRQKAKLLAGSPLTSQTKEVKLILKLPDFERRDIQTEIGKDSIAVRAHKKLSREIRKKGFFHSEKTERSFDYTTNVPEINPRKVKIEFKKGVLKIKAPRA